MNQKFKQLGLCALSALLIISLTGCQTGDNKKEVIPVDQNQTASTTVKPTTPSTPSVPQNPEAVKPVKAEQLQMSSTYSKIIKGYQDSLPRVTPVAALPEAEQVKLVEALKKDIAQKLPSSKIFKNFEAAVVKLSPDRADQLAEVAIKGLTANLSKDTQAIENLSSNSKFMNAYFEEADKVDRKFGLLVTHPDLVKNKEVKNLIMKARTMGYSVSSSEGMIYYLIDYAAFAKYNPCYTSDFANLMDDFAFDTLEPSTSDAALVISLDNVAARALHLENGMKAGGGTKYQQFQAVRYISNMMYFFYGANNTPNFDYETNRISEAGVEAYKKLSVEQNTQTAKATLSFMKAIEANKGIANDKLNKEADGIIKDLKHYYGVTDKTEKDYNEWMMGQ